MGLKMNVYALFITFCQSTVPSRCRGGGTPIYNLQGCSSKFSKTTPKSYQFGCGSSQFYSPKVTSEIFIHTEIAQEYWK